MANIITDENFYQYFRDTSKNKKEEGDLTVSYKSKMELPDCELKRDVIKLIYEVYDGVSKAVESLCLYAAASKQDAIRLCSQINTDLMSGLSFDNVCYKSYSYETILFFYIKPEYFPKEWLEEKNTSWSIMP